MDDLSGDLKRLPKPKLTKCMSVMVTHEVWDKLVVLKTFYGVDVPETIRGYLDKLIASAEAKDGRR